MLCRTVNANKQPIIDIIKKRVVANPRFGTSDSHIMYYSKQSSSFNMWNVGLLQRGGDCWAWQPKGERAVNEYMWIGKHILGASVINELTPTLNYFNGQSGAQSAERRAGTRGVSWTPGALPNHVEWEKCVLAWPGHGGTLRTVSVWIGFGFDFGLRLHADFIFVYQSSNVT